MGCCWCYTAAAVVLGVIAVMYVACRLRILPVPVMRGWYIFLLVVNILVMTGLTILIDKLRLLGLPRRTSQTLCTFVCTWTFWAPYGLAPHIRINVDESEVQWKDIPERSALALNHTSFFDAFFFTGSAPWTYIRNTKCMMKDSLKKLPIFGGIFNRVGHFPVYFKSDAEGNFSVDKDKQAVVMERVKEHLNQGGRLALFPEGAVNKTPRTLASFRHGMFSMVLEQKLPLYYMVMVGNEKTWPATASAGGLPASIDVTIHKFPIDFNQPDLTAQSLADAVQKAMQAKLDAIYAKREKKSN